MKKLPIDVSDFATMITQDYLYVDKTEHIYHLIKQGRLYFLSRPRRFGKSLLISTLKQIFLSNKQLFAELWIAKSDYAWEPSPVIHLDFSSISHKDADSFKADLIWILEQVAHGASLSIADAPSLETKTRSLITQLAAKSNVVLLVDEYDYPLLKNLVLIEKAKAIREVLSSFFTVVKSLDAYMRFILITGVTKFSKTSIFSGMNNLNDISLDLPGATLLGYTEEEIRKYFKPYIEIFCHDAHTSTDLLEKEIKRWYNGYKFSGNENAEKVYNPFSILHCLRKKEINNYWFESGTPSFLIDLLKTQYKELHEPFTDFDNVVLKRESLGAFDLEQRLPLNTLLFQTGYLTIKDFDKDLKTYTLTYPNEEVRISITAYLVSIVTSKGKQEVDAAVFVMRTALEKNDIETFCSHLRSLLANIPYNLYVNNEAYFHSLFHLLADLLGFSIQSEEPTSKGRIDSTLITKNRIFVFEFKFNATSQEALQQIQDRKYYEKYLNKGKAIILVGLSFNYEEKQLTIDWVAKNITAS